LSPGPFGAYGRIGAEIIQNSGKAGADLRRQRAQRGDRW
jgi:hypothetical protein